MEERQILDALDLSYEEIYNERDKTKLKELSVKDAKAKSIVVQCVTDKNHGSRKRFQRCLPDNASSKNVFKRKCFGKTASQTQAINLITWGL